MQSRCYRDVHVFLCACTCRSAAGLLLQPSVQCLCTHALQHKFIQHLWVQREVGLHFLICQAWRAEKQNACWFLNCTTLLLTKQIVGRCKAQKWWEKHREHPRKLWNNGIHVSNKCQKQTNVCLYCEVGMAVTGPSSAQVALFYISYTFHFHACVPFKFCFRKALWTVSLLEKCNINKVELS